MKKFMIFAAAAALALVAGCAKIENHAPDGNTQHAIGFSNYTPKALTKAGDTYVSGTSLVANKQFAVYAWATTYGNFLAANPGAPGFMNPAVVTWTDNDAEGANNSYTPLRYWPTGDTPDNLSFAAYYPYGGAGITAPTFDANTVGVYAFAAQGTAATMVDFCVADVVNDQVYGNTNATSGGANKGTVNLTFKHQLAKIQFKFKKATGLGTTTVIELVDAKLQNIKTTGTLTATFTQAGTPAVNTPGTTATAWSARAKASSAIVYDVTLNQSDPEAATPIVLEESLSTVHQDDIFLMVPQTMVVAGDSDEDSGSTCVAADEQKLVVTWNVKVYDTAANATANGSTTVGNGGLLSMTTNTATLSFKSDLVTSDTDNTGVSAINWAKNSFVTYTITIGPKPIWFTATVENWASEQNGYFNIN